MYSILTESYNQGLLNKPSYMFFPSLVLEISPEQSKYSKYLTSFVRHYTNPDLACVSRCDKLLFCSFHNTAQFLFKKCIE